jgi:hypothetical protein
MQKQYPLLEESRNRMYSLKTRSSFLISEGKLSLLRFRVFGFQDNSTVILKSPVLSAPVASRKQTFHG